jgi:hypothetical protein
LGITLFARREAAINRRVSLAAAFAVIFLGIALIGGIPFLIPARQLAPPISSDAKIWLAFWSILTVLLSWRFVGAVIDPSQRRVQVAVKSGILAIIALDAAIVLCVRGPMPSAIVLCLLVPTIALGRWVYST